MILNVTIPDELKPYLEAAAVAAGQPDLNSAVAAHLASLIHASARQSIMNEAMAGVSTQVAADMADVDTQNALIQVTES